MSKRFYIVIFVALLAVASVSLFADRLLEGDLDHDALVAFDQTAPVANGATPEVNGEVQYDKRAPIAYWQSYVQSPLVGEHQYAEGAFAYHLEKLKPPSDSFRTGYAFLHGNALIVQDLGNKIKYQVDASGDYQIVNLPDNYTYRSSTHQFSFDEPTGTLSACLRSTPESCETVKVKVGTFPYLYASKDDAVLSVSNYGDALLFKEGKWCRMSMAKDVYSCEVPEQAPLQQPRKIQFYSSVAYQGKVLVGEWPTGRLYEFDGSVLKPSNMTPPEIDKRAHLQLGYEAQSLAEYCGDLFVGYWPKGEVWRYDHTKREWQFFKRFFSGVKGENFIPYADRAPDELDSSFFGQRVTALVPFEDSLYVTTSNLRSWRSTDKVPAVLDAGKVAEYGAIYKITRQGCKSVYADAR